MEYGSMVHALELIHGLLKPEGILIDIHPQAESSIIEIHRGNDIEVVGNFEIPQWRKDFQEADIALAQILKDNVYSLEQKDTFDTLTYYESVDEMNKELNRSVDRYAREADSVDYEREQVRKLTDLVHESTNDNDQDADLTLRELVHISRMKPVHKR